MFRHTPLPRALPSIAALRFRRLSLVSSLRRGRHIAMFKKAVREHPAPQKPLASQKPLFPTSISAARSTTASISTGQTAGVKRKLDGTQQPSQVSQPSQTPLSVLHSNVYFDENDFDDDLDLDETINFSIPGPQSQLQSQSQAHSFTDSMIKYPELPSPLNKPPPPSENAPPSTIPIPWSSSPPAHQLPPPKRRTLPWSTNQGAPAPARYAAPPPAPARAPAPATARGPVKPEVRTPLVDKTATLPWNKTMSAVKEEQKELRKQQKIRITSEKKSGQLGTRAPKVPSIFLSEEQKRVVEAIVEQGKSIFFTGSAGTGKSVLMREIIRKLRAKHRREPDRIAVTASTGLAACNIEGVTLHSFAGIGLGKENVADLVKKVKRNQKNRTRWLRTKVLIVDEISMVDGDLFDKLEEVARKIRNNGRPFGGIQLVVTGDFFQLPPVPDSNKVAKFAFSSATWNTTIQHTILLTHVFRQKDPKFASMLNEMRLGKLSQETINAFKQLSRPLDFHDSLEATELFPTRTEVENANSARMARLSGEIMIFTAVDSGTMQNETQRSQLLADCVAPVIQLKKGAQVMLIKNMDETLVNGSLGKVVAFMDEARFDYYSKNEDDFVGDQGPDDPSAQALKKLKAYENKDQGINTRGKWPVVCFVQPDGTERHLLCQPETWKIELPNGEVRAQRTQVPLILAWALSIHKAQGQTLQRVKVDLGRVFEKGQAYVALSRATTQSGLQVSRFDPRRVMVHPKVLEFYSNLSSIHNINEPVAPARGTLESARRTNSEAHNDWDDPELAGLYA